MQLDFRKVTEGQTLNFAKDCNSQSNKITFNLNWTTRGGSVDLDAFLVTESRKGAEPVTTTTPKRGFWAWLCRLFGGNPVDVHTTRPAGTGAVAYYFGKLTGQGIKHHGDDLTGAWSDGEFIEVDLDKLHPSVDTLTFSVLSFSGHDFSRLPSASIKVFEGTPTKPQKGLVEHSLTDFKRGTMAVAVGQMKREADGTWAFTAVRKVSGNKSVQAMIPLAKSV